MSGEMEEADTGGETDRDEEDRDTEGERSIEGEREMRERGEEEPGGREWPGGGGGGRHKPPQTGTARGTRGHRGPETKRPRGGKPGDSEPGAERDQGEAGATRQARTRRRWQECRGKMGLRTAPSQPPVTLLPVQAPALVAKQTWAESELHHFLVATAAMWRDPPPPPSE